MMGAISAFLIAFLMMLTFVGCVGIKVTKFKAPTKFQVAAYGLSVFVLIFIPFTSFGGTMKIIQSVTDFDQQVICSDITDVHKPFAKSSTRAKKRQSDRRGDFNRLSKEKQALELTLKFFQSIDMQMMVISQKMCSAVCPCSPLVEFQGNKTNLINAKQVYYNIDEDTLNEHGRTKFNKKDYIPLVFNGIFTTFEDCFEYHFKRMNDEKDLFSEYDMVQTFKVDFNPDRAN